MVKRNTLNRVKEHYDFVLKHYNGNTDCVFGVFLVGSQNYGLDDENSDVDTRAVVLPTLYELATNKPPVSTTLMFPKYLHYLSSTDDTIDGNLLQ